MKPTTWFSTTALLAMVFPAPSLAQDEALTTPAQAMVVSFLPTEYLQVAVVPVSPGSSPVHELPVPVTMGLVDREGIVLGCSTKDINPRGFGTFKISSTEFDTGSGEISVTAKPVLRRMGACLSTIITFQFQFCDDMGRKRKG